MALASALKPPNSGGYDHDFVNTVPDRYMCSSVCTKVLRDPHLTSCCGQHFCESCLNKWFKKHHEQSCPHCRAKGGDFSHFLDKKLKREISELKIWCSNKDNGCQWTGELQSLEKHIGSEDGCGYVRVECPNNSAGNKKKIKSIFGISSLKHEPRCPIMFQKDLNEHVQNICVHRLVACEYCGKKDKFYRIHGDHSDSCKKHPLACPNECGTTNIPREDMPAHRKKCPLEPVTCPFTEAGCQMKLIRKQLDKHLADNQQTHLLQLMADYKKVVKQLEETKRAVTVQTGRLESMQGSTQNKINGYGTKHGLKFSIPSKEYFKLNKEWYSPAFYLRGVFYDEDFKGCLHAQLAPQGHLEYSVVVLTDRGEYDGTITVRESTGGGDIEFDCPFSVVKYGTIQGFREENPVQHPSTVTVFLMSHD